MRNILTAVGLATWVAGVLDLGFALAAAIAGKKPMLGVLTGIANGPFRDPDLTRGLTGAFVGLAVHFALMLVIVVVFVAAARWIAFMTRHPWISGAVYGVIVYLVMYWIVLPQRWPAAFPHTDPGDIAKAVFVHVAFVGLPIALITARLLRPAPADAQA